MKTAVAKMAPDRHVANRVIILVSAMYRSADIQEWSSFHLIVAASYLILTVERLSKKLSKKKALVLYLSDLMDQLVR